MEEDSQYIYKDNKKLRCGYTTGSCAAAAAKAAVIMLLTGDTCSYVSLLTPKGITLYLTVEDIVKEEEFVSCGIEKDSGDDPDVTNGIVVYARVSKTTEAGIQICAGNGVGVVTKAGLEQPVGAAAINRVPRKMITEAVQEIMEEQNDSGGIRVEISVPGGEKVAQKTFNPRLGIVGGISILGTSGIVEPMSEKAIIDSIRVEMKMRIVNGMNCLLITPGNYGETYAKEILDLDMETALKCSNFVGETIDMAVELCAEEILFVSHIGKFIKVAGGIMNTHSRNADCRMELFASCAVLAGADLNSVQKILGAPTTDEAITILKSDEHYEKTIQLILEKIEYYLIKRSYHKLKIGVVLFSNQHGFLGQTTAAEELLHKLKQSRR